MLLNILLLTYSYIHCRTLSNKGIILREDEEDLMDDVDFATLEARALKASGAVASMSA